MNTSTNNTTVMLGVLATMACEYDALTNSIDQKRDAINKALTECKQTGIAFALQGRDGKSKADRCPNRKVLKAALMKGGMGEQRAGAVMGMLAMYHEAGVEVQTLRDYASVKAVLGPDVCERLGFTPKADTATKSDPTTPNGSTVADCNQLSGKEQISNGKVKPSRMPKLTPIWGLYEHLMQHEDAALFTDWIQSDKSESLQSFVEGRKATAVAQQKLASALAEVERLKAMLAA